jgi:TRAP-type C4-dicarboxylate transport system permease large subunit
MTLLTIPIVFPVIVNLGYDPIWFGVMLTLLGEMGLITPPVGMNVYVVSGVTKVPLEDVFRGIIPFYIGIVVCVGLLYIFPQITLFLPGVMK